jgi:hypothetical protein
LSFLSTQSSFNIQKNFLTVVVLKLCSGCAIGEIVSHRLVTAEIQVYAYVSYVGFVVEKVAQGQVFLQVLQYSHHYHYTAAQYSFMYHLVDGQ